MCGLLSVEIQPVCVFAQLIFERILWKWLQLLVICRILLRFSSTLVGISGLEPVGFRTKDQIRTINFGPAPEIGKFRNRSEWSANQALRRSLTGSSWIYRRTLERYFCFVWRKFFVTIFSIEKKNSICLMPIVSDLKKLSERSPDPWLTDWYQLDDALSVSN